MNAAVESNLSSAPAGGPVLRTLVVCDLVDSTALTQRLGDERAIELFRKHDRLGRDLLAQHHGREIDKTDGFLLLFERPIQAAAFAIDYQRALRGLSRSQDVGLRARIGIHMGDVLLWENSADDVAQGAKPLEIEGMVKGVSARLMGLALPGQILLSGVAHTLIQKSLPELGERADKLRFKGYGQYRFKGVADPIPIYEMGEPEIAPLKRPASGGKAHRDLPWWRQPTALAVESILLLAAIAVSTWFATHSEPTFAFAPRDWAVVADLQNRTGQAVFDDSLQTAFRIGLEQSRYVNVLSDLQVRDTLKRMQRDERSAVDPIVASEVAQREGVRAVIVPTLAEVGGKLRFHAEVVDPISHRTVYAESAEGSGAGSALASVDQVVRSLREQLGEAVASIQSQPQPLAKVTTTSLDALRAYTLAVRTQARGKWNDAIGLYQQALKFDPNFALAHMGLARIWFSVDEYDKSKAELELALAEKERLPPRDAVYLEAWRTNFGNPAERLEKWKLLATLYPDYFAGYHNYALFAWQEYNDFDGALAMIEGELSPHNPFRASAHYQRAMLLLGLGRYQEALTATREAAALGLSGSDEVGAMTHLALRDQAASRKALAAEAPSRLGNLDLRRGLSEAVIEADLGHVGKAATLADSLARDAAAAGKTSARLAEATALSVGQFNQQRDAYESRLSRFIEQRLAELSQPEAPRPEAAIHEALLMAYLAAHTGHEALARKVVVAVQDRQQVRDYPASTQLLVVAGAELQRLLGKPEDAIAALQPLMGHGEPYLAHVALRDALVGAHLAEAAMAESEWLASHRGRALAEGTSDGVCRALNIIESDLALLSAAELAQELGRADRSVQHLAEFGKAWPDADRLPAVAARLDALKQKQRRVAPAV